MSGLAPALAAALAEIEVDVPAGRARVGPREVTVEHPRDLRAHLSRAVYDVLHAGRAEPEQRRRSLRDAELDAAYAAAVPHRHTVLSAPVLDRRSDAVLIERDGVRTWLPATAIRDDRGATATLAVSPVRAALSPGFFLVDGSVGRSVHRPLLRVYVHLAGVRHAAEIWRAALAALEATGVRYRTKIGSARPLFPRRDGLVVYLGRDDWAACHRVAAAVAGRPGVGAATSVFAHRLADGVAVACEPVDPRPGMRGLSLGEHRAAAITAAVLDDPATPLTDRVAAALRAANVDPAQPARNADSPPLPGSAEPGRDGSAGSG